MKVKIGQSSAKIKRLKSTEHHECEPRIEGDWIVFRCPKCIDYERWINALTGELMASSGTIDLSVQHSGRINIGEKN